MILENGNVLIVDDDAEVRKLMSDVLGDEGYEVRAASDEQEALMQIKKCPPDVLFLDLWIGDDESAGVKILEKTKKINSDIPIVIISGHGSIDAAVRIIRSGAFDFIEKPFVIERLLVTCRSAIEMRRLKQENNLLRNNRLCSDIFSIGTSIFANSIASQLEKIASSNSRVFLESPLGMEADVMAYSIHKKSNRRDKFFVSMNCFCYDSDEFFQDFFGSEDSYGNLEKADGGTIFLDEIDKISPDFQRKLLSFLLEGKVRLGTRSIYSDARVICSATAENMKNALERKEFSTELFYRLKISEIIIPEIRRRREDVAALVNYYLARSDQFFGMPTKKITENALAILQSYDWPGNMLQIKNVVENSLISASDSTDIYISEIFLPSELISSTSDKFDSLNIAKFITMPLKEAKDKFESDYLSAQVERFSGNISQTANFIGMERSALHRKMKALNVHVRKNCSAKGSR
ncbi:MAG: sigma-54 dependent transcriptional regulator [Holosporaceae bacterium]|jgi:two-component system nitrogen regulation response regulator NtrX|nr:sigma-54 dependent transcriptional regulator [Holosporaceae bacterium]